MKKNAFTLAEVLITLGIIGVVAALTMPSLIAKYEKIRTVTQLKKAYSIINQAVKLSEIDNGPMEDWEPESYAGGLARPYIDKYWAPYLKVIKTCNNYTECGYTAQHPYVWANGQPSGVTAVSTAFRLPLITTDGLMYIIGVAGGTGTLSNDIFIDLNGSRPPNKYGRDFFHFVRVPGKGVLPAGWDLSESEINSNCSKTTDRGLYCAAKIMQDGWEIKDDYSW